MQTEIAIVLGGGRDSPETLNERSLQRVALAVSLFEKKAFPLIIASGGISFTADSDAKLTEATLLASALAARGIPEGSILKEESSTDTLGNLYFSRVEHIDRIGARSLTIVTSDFHIPRCQWITQKVFGPTYSVTFEGSYTEIAAAELQGLRDLERHIQKIYGRWLDPVSPGAHVEVGEILKTRHPGHGNSPDYSKQEFIELLYGKKAG